MDPDLAPRLAEHIPGAPIVTHVLAARHALDDAARWDLSQTLECAVGCREEAVHQIAQHCGRSGAARDPRQFEQRCRLGRERQPPAGRHGEQRFLASPVTGQNQATAIRIPDRNREHAVDVARELHPVVFEEMNDGRGVGSGRHLVAGGSQSCRQVTVVVELAVHDRVHARGLVGEHPGGRIGCHDRETGEPERHLDVAPQRDAVGAAMSEARYHPTDVLRALRRGEIRGPQPRDAAHVQCSLRHAAKRVSR